MAIVPADTDTACNQLHNYTGSGLISVSLVFCGSASGVLVLSFITPWTSLFHIHHTSNHISGFPFFAFSYFLYLLG